MKLKISAARETLQKANRIRLVIQEPHGTRCVSLRCYASLQQEDSPMRIALAALAVAFSTSAFAQTTEFYVVQDAATKRCTIVDKRPTTQTTVVVGNGVFKTRSEAETGMKSIKVCTTN